MTPALSVRGLGAAYGAVVAAADINLDVSAAECVALVGANGAGKTSVLRAIGGLIPSSPTTEVTLGERSLTRQDAAGRARRGLAHVLEGRHVFAGMSVRENLELGVLAARGRAGRRGMSAAIDEVRATLPELDTSMEKPAGTLSGGQQQMLAIGRALVGAPSVVMMDEPTNGLAPILVDRVIEIIRVICAQGIGVLLVEQRLEVAQATSQRVFILQRGRQGEALLASDPGLADKVHAAYLS